MARITAVSDRAVATPAAHLAVLLGLPGLGKSRLIGEFARRSGETATVVAHCDAAGGVTFAPLAEALRELLSIDTGASSDSVRAETFFVVPVVCSIGVGSAAGLPAHPRALGTDRARPLAPAWAAALR